MKENKPFVANKNHFYFFFGIFLFFFSIILCLNNGVVGRALATPFTYVFGASAYVFYLFCNLLGLRLIFTKKFFKIKFNIYVIATILLLISALMLFTHFTVINEFSDQYVALNNNAEKGTINLFDAYSSVFDKVKENQGGDYFKQGFLSLLSYPFGGGILGYLLVGAFNELFAINNGGFIAAIILLCFAILFYFMPLILRLISQSKQKDDKQKKEEKDTYSDVSAIKSSSIKIRNIDPVKHANEIDENYQSEIIGQRKGVAMSAPTFIDKDSMAANFSITDNGMFEKARFVTDNGQNLEGKQEEKNPDQNFVSENIEQNNFESRQIEIDFDEEELLSEEPVTPAFVTPTLTQEIQNPEPISGPQPKVEQPKPVVKAPWIQPSSNILETYETSEQKEINERSADEKREIINTTFSDFGIGAQVEDYTIGPSITRFNIRYNHNVSVRSVSNMIPDIQIRLSGAHARFENVVEGQTTSGLEIPNEVSTTVSFKDVYEALPNVKKTPLAVPFGKNIKGDVIWADLAKFPHMLVSGTTGSGKSVFTNSIIVSLIMRNSPDDLKLVLVDPKKVEMMRYKDMPHLLCPIITDANEAKLVLDKLVEEMEERYDLFAANGCSNITEFNEDAPGLGLEKIPYIVVFIDEYADIVENCKDISTPVVMIAQKARACGIHLSIATQRPSTNVITGVIKANLPTRVALLMANAVDSMTIIGEGGAEDLIGNGDMLVQCPLIAHGGALVRLQGCFIQRHEMGRVIGYLKEHYETHYNEKFLNLSQKAEAANSDYANTPEFKDSKANSEEESYQSIKEWVLCNEFMSISRIQRECSVGFNRAGRFFLRLQEEGVVAKNKEGNSGCRVIGGNSLNQEETVVTSDEQSYFRSDD